MEIDYSSYLPEPTPLIRAAIVEFSWGDQHFKMLVSAADVRDEPWESGEIVTWLHCKGVQFFDQLPRAEQEQKSMTFMIPAAYITSVLPGPGYRIKMGNKTEDVGMFPPIHPTSRNTIGVGAVKAKIAELMSPERN